MNRASPSNGLKIQIPWDNIDFAAEIKSIDSKTVTSIQGVQSFAKLLDCHSEEHSLKLTRHTQKMNVEIETF